MASQSKYYRTDSGDPEAPTLLAEHTTARGHRLVAGLVVNYANDAMPGLGNPTPGEGPMRIDEVLSFPMPPDTEHPEGSAYVSAILDGGRYECSADNLVPAPDALQPALASCGHVANADGECSCSWWPERAPIDALDAERALGQAWAAPAGTGPDEPGWVALDLGELAPPEPVANIYPPGCDLPGCRHHYPPGRNLAREGCRCPSWADSGGWHLTSVNPGCGAHVAPPHVAPVYVMPLPEPDRVDGAEVLTALGEATAAVQGRQWPDTGALTSEAFTVWEGITSGRFDPFLPILSAAMTTRRRELAAAETITRIRDAGGNPDDPDDPGWQSPQAPGLGLRGVLLADGLRKMARDLRDDLALGGRSPFTAEPVAAVFTLETAADRIDGGRPA